MSLSYQFKMNKILFSILLALSISGVSKAVEFNMNIIDAKDRDNIDLSQFSNPDFVPPGEYLTDITLNGRKLSGQYLIKFIEQNKDTSALCITPEIINLFALKKTIKEQILQNNNTECIELPKSADINYRFDKANQNILFSVPQAWLEYDDPYWVPPSQWENGITGAFLDYNLFANYSAPKNNSETFSASSNGTTGANLGAWRFRADYQYQYNRSQGKTNERFDWTQLYAFRAFPELGAKVLLGESYLRTDLFDSFRFLGASFFSDNRMLPPSLRGYAPQITGIAQTNATVIISQNGRVIKQTRVAPGPFNIQDITEAVQGTLDVTIEEDDGSKTTYQVTATSLPFLTRQGQFLYKFAAGKSSPFGRSQRIEPRFISGEVSYGILSNTSLFGGLIATVSNNDYQAINLGIGQNMNQFGAISFDITRTHATLDNFGTYSGNSYRLNYSKRFESTNSQVTFAGYKFSEKEFLTMPQYIDAANGVLDFRRDKNVYTASFNQYISPLDVTLYFNASHHQFWNSESTTTFGMSLSKLFNLGKIKNVSTTLSLNKIKYQETDDNQIYLSFSIPLESGASVSYDMQYANGGKDFGQTVAYYSENIDNNYWSLRAGGDKRELGRMEPSISGSYQHSSPYGVLNINGSENINSYRSLGGSWYGSMTATKYGASLHRNGTNNEPRVMIDSGDVAGISIDNGQSVTNRFGVGVATSLNSFSNSDVYIDMNTLPDDVDVNDNIIGKTLTEGAIGYQTIKANQGKRVLAIVRLADGKYPPLGTSVTEVNSGREAGIIADSGIVYLTGINTTEKYVVKWAGGSQQCSLNFANFSEQQQSKALLPCL
ncbi:fimbria/pilus outer membrane usher protein [Providencia burhodogranariea]|uniref:Outer membrane fimbrial usher porin n=1 Tax=Providencia burhodogranariea DSM 19968 TaxID=1141662 RepID=K8WTH0_9GAMM|nr:fimbria/pilus outer membrane usher protein [Providencia burhodogranariea]EKT60742.1 outer membrane fimbrial usher porin [Providencia burhodogranariea DSM 19968]